MPWINVKFSHFMSGGKKTLASLGEEYQAFQSVGISAAGEVMSLESLSKYKYHIDLGGGGGTTWSGTLEKLAMPGLLFHHVTPTKDYFHDALVPWVHYVPVAEDLGDLMEKYEWAEAHPEEARKIAERGTEWVREWYGSVEGFRVTFDEFYRKPLQSVVDAYVHDKDWKGIMEREGKNMKPILRCSGFVGSECEYLDPKLDYHANH